jgi:DNA-binding NarL/FixJ family response regulator
VDDYAPFRRVVRLILQSRTDLALIGEAGDGLDAIREALRLQPDLIVLDLDLPSLNGIQVARRLVDKLPNTKIVFIGVESSAAVVEEAMKVGAGYVHKIRTSAELLPAIDKVLGGGQYLGTDVSAPQVHVQRRSRLKYHHEVAFYPTETSLAMGLARYIEATAHRGNVIVTIATDPHRQLIIETLSARGLHLADLARKGRCTWLDPDETLSLFMVDNWPDASRFRKVLGDLVKSAVESAKQGNRRVAACGELAPILWARGNRNAAIEIEALWDEMCAAHGIDTLCGYVSATADRDRHLRQFNRICAAHSAVHFR